MSASLVPSTAVSLNAPPAAVLSAPYRALSMGADGGADHRNQAGIPLDVARSSGPINRRDEEFEQAAMCGLLTIRESIGRHLSEAGPGRHDFARLRRLAPTAERHGIHVLRRFMDDGTAPDVSLLADAVSGRFARSARIAATAACKFAPSHKAGFPHVSTSIDEIGFLASAVSTLRVIDPDGAHRASRESAGPRLACCAIPGSTPQSAAIRWLTGRAGTAGRLASQQAVGGQSDDAVDRAPCSGAPTTLLRWPSGRRIYRDNKDLS